MTRIIKNTRIAVSEILKGNVIGLPTETVYGLGADALNPDAVIKIFEVKRRPRFNPLIVHVHSAFEFEKYAKDIPGDVYKIAEKFSPGPVTFILKKKNIIPDIVTAGLDTVAIRIPDHPLFLKVLKNLGRPVAAPSANIFGRISPTNADDVFKELNGKINYILDGGRSKVGIESTIISFLNNKITILRPGFVTAAEIENITGKTVISRKNTGKILSPGMLKSHYAPVKPLYITTDTYFEGRKEILGAGILDLMKYNNLNTAVSKLFSALRKLDEKDYDFIIAIKVPDTGIGVAINDRLERASKGTVRIETDLLKFKYKKK